MPSLARFITLVLVGTAVTFVVGAQATPSSWNVKHVRMQLPPRVRITGGWFSMGSDDAAIAAARALCDAEQPCDAASFAAEQPAQRVYVRAYAIDRMEVSNAEHRRCVSSGQCYPPQLGAADALESDHPVVMLTFTEARDYCRFAGGDLPTEAQWEYAARGGSKRTFPWGMLWNAGAATFAAAGASAVDSHREGKSFFGLFNMAGNVAEPVLDYFSPGYEATRERIDPEGPVSGTLRVLRGGSFRSPPRELRVSQRASIAEDEARPDVGLRCAYRRP